MRKDRRDFHREAILDPYELGLSAYPEGHCGFVIFRDPKRLPTESAFNLAKQSDPEAILRTLLTPEDFALFWREWRTAPIDETNNLVEDVMRHYGADPGKAAS